MSIKYINSVFLCLAYYFHQHLFASILILIIIITIISTIITTTVTTTTTITILVKLQVFQSQDNYNNVIKQKLLILYFREKKRHQTAGVTCNETRQTGQLDRKSINLRALYSSY